MNAKAVHVHLYSLLERAVETGVAYGYRRAFKHTDELDAHALIEEVVRGVMLELCEVIDFEHNVWREEQVSPEGFGDLDN